MKSAMMRMLSRILIVSLMMLPLQAAQAGMIGAGQVAAVAGAQAERQAVLSMINRSEVANQMQSLGLDAKTAADRVAAMTDEEVRTLSGKLESAPAGASDGLVLAAVIIIAVVLYYKWK